MHIKIRVFSNPCWLLLCWPAETIWLVRKKMKSVGNIIPQTAQQNSNTNWKQNLANSFIRIKKISNFQTKIFLRSFFCWILNFIFIDSSLFSFHLALLSTGFFSLAFFSTSIIFSESLFASYFFAQITLNLHLASKIPRTSSLFFQLFDLVIQIAKFGVQTGFQIGEERFHVVSLLFLGFNPFFLIFHHLLILNWVFIFQSRIPLFKQIRLACSSSKFLFSSTSSIFFLCFPISCKEYG